MCSTQRGSLKCCTRRLSRTGSPLVFRLPLSLQNQCLSLLTLMHVFRVESLNDQYLPPSSSQGSSAGRKDDVSATQGHIPTPLVNYNSTELMC